VNLSITVFRYSKWKHQEREVNKEVRAVKRMKKNQYKKIQFRKLIKTSEIIDRNL